MIEATAFDVTQTIVAGQKLSVTLPSSSPVEIPLHCQSLVCSQATTDAATPSPDGGADGPGSSPPTCGNGRLDPGETCDTARAPELPGACPATCDDGIPCTRDDRSGDGCVVLCSHLEITIVSPGDGCCPANAGHATDPDCSATCGTPNVDPVVDPGETCDIAITTGPGLCPKADSCDDKDPCTVDQLISAATCSARCSHTPIVVPADSDACCPIGANAKTDSDCVPACGNGVLEPGEQCDPAIVSGPEACPTAADCDDADPCTVDLLTGGGCQVTCRHRTIDMPAPGDGCCPVTGLGKNVDSDCPALCGNGVVEDGETCDRALPATAPGGCPAFCPSPPQACSRYVMQGSLTDCTAACVLSPVKACSPTSDGCCPTGCTRATDPDCSATCGNGRLDAGETCDTAIASGAGACPTTCADGMPCTDDLLIDGGTCSARCLFVPTTAFRGGDGCCPPGAHAAVDSDCPATCGNGVVEIPSETCDTGSTPFSCPTSCPQAETCATWTLTASTGCNVRCVRQPITTCADGDACCPPGCNATTDSDCAPLCGNGVREPPEVCDSGITAGQAGACPASCVDRDPCTLDFARGTTDGCTRACSHVPVTACAGGDRCCPAGCTAANDSDCGGICGDRQVQAGETCDPASTCPTNCADDGDPCTVDQLVGSAATCNAACAHIPILHCSGSQRDGCCPTECSSASDSDC